MQKRRKWASRQPGSGNGPIKKGDVISSVDLIECKQTGGQSIRLQQEWLSKIERQALAQGKMPALEIEFLNQDRKSGIMTQKWMVIPRWWFLDLIEGDE